MRSPEVALRIELVAVRLQLRELRGGPEPQQATARRDVNAAATKLEIIIHSSGGTSPAFYLDEFSAYEGDQYTIYSIESDSVLEGGPVLPEFMNRCELWSDVLCKVTV